MRRMIGVLACVLLLAGCGERGAALFQGYAEGDLIFVGPDEAGRLLTLHVDEGDRVTPGQPLFEVDPALQQADVDTARGQLAQAQANLENLKASTQRPEEIAVLEASQRRAQAALDLSVIERDRQRNLYEKNVGSKAAYDTAQATYNENQAALNEIERQIEVGRMASRDQQIAAAEQAVAAAKASLDAAQTRLDRRNLASTREGSVETVYFRPGELVPVGRPVISVLPPELIKVRFFVPEPDLPRFRLGQTVEVTCDGCAAAIPAKVSFISASAEYTPPVIYSLDERSKLVFLLEAKPDDPLSLRPGQPVSVGLAP
ncbi:HlyD family secretion protein [Ancylobacter sp. G4_0304]|uniref:HlyD family secretion protein n=1 Tax=Ancylobacter sp. G4_0304 TaxID=3114289 RepID=UPI0039C6EF31